MIGFPIVRALRAANVQTAAVWLLCLALVAAAARRQAVGEDQWSYEAVPTSSTWRALRALTIFEVVPSVLNSVFASLGMPRIWQILSYLPAAALLLQLTWRDGMSARLWARRRNAWFLLTGVAGAAVAAAANWAYLKLLDAFSISWPVSSGIDQQDAGVALLVIVFIAPVAEEYFYRGWLQPAIRREWANAPGWLAPLVGAFVFAAAHPPLAMIPVFVLGCVTAAVYFASEAIAPCIIVHALYNLAALLLVRHPLVM